MNTRTILSSLKRSLGIGIVFGSWIYSAGIVPAYAVDSPPDTNVVMDVMDASLTITASGKTSSVGVDQTYTMELDKDAAITVSYNLTQKLVIIKNECSSKRTLHIQILGMDFDVEPCKSQDISLSSAEESTFIPDTPDSREPHEDPNEGREPISNITPR